jgi:hypothetical protein
VACVLAEIDDPGYPMPGPLYADVVVDAAEKQVYLASGRGGDLEVRKVGFDDVSENRNKTEGYWDKRLFRIRWGPLEPRPRIERVSISKEGDTIIVDGWGKEGANEKVRYVLSLAERTWTLKRAGQPDRSVPVKSPRIASPVPQETPEENQAAGQAGEKKPTPVDELLRDEKETEQVLAKPADAAAANEEEARPGEIETATQSTGESREFPDRRSKVSLATSDERSPTVPLVIGGAGFLLIVGLGTWLLLRRRAA